MPVNVSHYTKLLGILRNHCNILCRISSFVNLLSRVPNFYPRGSFSWLPIILMHFNNSCWTYRISYNLYRSVNCLSITTSICHQSVIHECDRNLVNVLLERVIVAPDRGKSKGLDTCYSAAYMSQTRDQQRSTISEVAADWHELIVPQRIMWPSIARPNGQLDQRCS